MLSCWVLEVFWIFFVLSSWYFQVRFSNLKISSYCISISTNIEKKSSIFVFDSEWLCWGRGIEYRSRFCLLDHPFAGGKQYRDLIYTFTLRPRFATARHYELGDFVLEAVVGPQFHHGSRAQQTFSLTVEGRICKLIIVCNFQKNMGPRVARLKGVWDREKASECKLERWRILPNKIGGEQVCFKRRLNKSDLEKNEEMFVKEKSSWESDVIWVVTAFRDGNDKKKEI